MFLLGVCVNLIAENGSSAVVLDKTGFQIERGTSGQTSVHPQGGWRRVDKVVFNAQATGGAAKIEVLADGEVRCTKDVNGTASEMSCPIERTSKSISFRHINGGRVTIWCITSYQSDQAPSKFNLDQWDGNLGTNGNSEEFAYPEDGSPLPEIEITKGSPGTAKYLAKRSERIIQLLFRAIRDDLFDEEDVDLGGLKNDLNSLRVVTAIALSKARPNGDLSFTTIFAMLRLQKQIDGCQDSIKRLLKRGNTYYLALDLLTVREFIEDRLDTYQLEKLLDKDPKALEKLLGAKE